jgi:hypothetical protein
MNPARPLLTSGLHRLAVTLGDIRCRYVYKAFDAAMTAHLGAAHLAADGPAGAAGSRSYQRAQSFASALAAVLPQTFEWSRRRLLQPELLPFASEHLELLSYGSGVTVFLMRRRGGDDREANVLKVFRKSLGQPLVALLRQAHERRATYDRVASWYQNCSVVLPTQFLVLNGPLLARPAVACVQPFVGGEKTDIFTDLSEVDLVERLSRDEPLRAQFRRFAEQTLHAADTAGACIDLVGRNNVVLTRNGDQLRLLLLDLGVYDFATKARRAPGALVELKKRLIFLQCIHDQVAS